MLISGTGFSELMNFEGSCWRDPGRVVNMRKI